MPTYMQKPVKVEIVPLEPLKYFKYDEQPEWVRHGLETGMISPGKTEVVVFTDKKKLKRSICYFSDYIMLNPDGTFGVISKNTLEERYDKVMMR